MVLVVAFGRIGSARRRVAKAPLAGAARPINTARHQNHAGIASPASGSRQSPADDAQAPADCGNIARATLRAKAVRRLAAVRTNPSP